jgi:hypothetical protein
MSNNMQHFSETYQDCTATLLNKHKNIKFNKAEL